MNEGRLAEAEALLRDALEADPDSFGLRDRLADLLLFTGQRTEALTQRQRALASNPHTPQAYRALADTCDILGRHGDAAQTMEQYLTRWPEDRYALHVLAYCYEREGQPQRALHAWRRLLQIVPDHFSARRGVARLGGGARPGQVRVDQSPTGPPLPPSDLRDAGDLSDANRWM